MAKSVQVFDFEKPIVELEERLADVKRVAEENDMDVSSATKELEEKIQSRKNEIYSNLSRWQRVQISRHPNRPYALDYIDSVCDGFVELFGDRNFADDKAMIGGMAKIDGQSVIVVGQQKGRTTKDRQYRNFGMPNPEGYRKALRMMKMAEKFSLPVICFIDTPGAFPGLEAEERGQGEAIARNLYEMAGLRVPIICVVIGEGASGGALGIGVGDKVYMMENTWYSVISPESCSSILWRSWDHKETAAEALKLTAEDNLRLGIIDGIIPEPLGGAHKQPEAAYVAVKAQLSKDIKALCKAAPDDLIESRLDKFTKIGAFEKLDSAL
ncbi:MAG: acetyl-CoA carboxylase carboxyltransferase subunit alpha [Bacteroidia bacterium]